MTEHSINDFTRDTLDALQRVGRDFGEHSIFSPSGSSMWAFCSGSLIPNLFQPDTAGEDAAYGTVGHSVGEKWLKSGIRPSELVGTVQQVGEFEIAIDESMMGYVEQYFDWCACLPGSHHVETRVDFSDLTPIVRQRGTADHAACEYRKLTITDLKLGKGVQVFAKENTQGILYAYGFFREWDWLYDFQTIVIRIAQPRLDHFDVWEITREELLKWAAWLKERAYAAWCKDAERSPGNKQCTFCKIKLDCAAYIAFMERMCDGVFDNLEEPITGSEMAGVLERIDEGMLNLTPIESYMLTLDQKARLLPYKSMVTSWFEALSEDLNAKARAGVKIPGYKLVEGRSIRVFTSETDAVETLDFLGLSDEQIHPRGLISPAQAEESLMKIGYKRKSLPDLLKGVVTKPPGKPTLVPDSDPRPELDDHGDVFDNLDDDL